MKTLMPVTARGRCRRTLRLNDSHWYGRLWVSIAMAALWVSGECEADPTPLPKYGAKAVRLHRSRDYIQRNPAPDFWALVPYYTAQPNDSACSTATAAMVVNALRASSDLNADQQLATPLSVLSHVPATEWREKVSDSGPGVTLDEFARLLPQVATAFQLRNTAVDVQYFEDASPESARHLRKLLSQNEQSDRDIVIVNFLQGSVTGDPEGNVGHLAPVAAFDADRDRVLLFDPDRRWYEPYWVPVDVLLKAMATRDQDAGRNRGLLRVSRGDRPAAANGSNVPLPK